MNSSGYEVDRRFRELVENSGGCAWEIDAAARFVFVSPRLVFGWPADNLLGKTVAEFLADPEQAGHFAATEPATVGETRFRAADGGTVLLTLAARPVLGATGLWNGARGICRVRGAQDLTQTGTQIRDGVVGQVVRAVRDETQPESALTVALTALGLAVGAAGGAILRAGGDQGTRPAIIWGATLPTAGPPAASSRPIPCSIAANTRARSCCGAAPKSRPSAIPIAPCWAMSPTISASSSRRSMRANASPPCRAPTR